MNKFLLVVLGSSILLTGCFGKKEPVPVNPVVVAPIYTEADRPKFEAEIDEEDAFDKALEAIPADEVPQFVEVIDDVDADGIQGAEEDEKLELETQEDKTQRAASVARGVARAQNKDGAGNKGLEFRTYSEELMAQVKGVRSALLFFGGADCVNCIAWEEALRTEAAAFADKNALIMMADFEEEAELAAEMNVTEPGWAMIVTGIGEFMGPRPTTHLTKDHLEFIFP